jgi:two-component sensor histidine kinase
MLRTFWNTLSLTGVQYHYDEKLIKRIMLSNQFGMVAIIAIILGGINNFLIGDTASAIAIELIALLCVAVFWINKLHRHHLAISYLLTVFSSTIFFFDSYSGFEAGAYLYYFPLVLAISFMFDFSEKRHMLVHLAFIFLLLFINIATDHSLFKNESLSPLAIKRLFSFNLICAAAAIAFFMYLTVANNIRESIIFEQRINERKATEEAITQALKEKDVLLAEIHHRVKNNLAIIASLFNLQISTVENEMAKGILLDSKNRVKSMALIHDRLYKSDSLSEIDFSKYTSELIDEIKYSYPTLARNIQVNTHISNVSLTVNNAIPCGLILNELLTNCYKHAFKGMDSGTIDVSFRGQGSSIELQVRDNGVGLKTGYNQGESLGMVVIESLSQQLDGRSEFKVENGTTFRLCFEQLS